ncbi:uncharacterized protein LOC124362991 isoform X15 [Homalodisca vitripennis]|uniref:uncharacterized protein LOC124362991 isoform X15 n=1 Tax=Homalodisca vitripennis TaxID=197043 RepID=UPI001EEB3E99|nr:uncharacterized protein LOC124362991 isoform X15 [Homalodisca vitripennis]
MDSPTSDCSPQGAPQSAPPGNPSLWSRRRNRQRHRSASPCLTRNAATCPRATSGGSPAGQRNTSPVAGPSGLCPRTSPAMAILKSLTETQQARLASERTAAASSLYRSQSSPSSSVDFSPGSPASSYATCPTSPACSPISPASSYRTCPSSPVDSLPGSSPYSTPGHRMSRPPTPGRQFVFPSAGPGPSGGPRATSSPISCARPVCRVEPQQRPQGPAGRRSPAAQGPAGAGPRVHFAPVAGGPGPGQRPVCQVAPQQRPPGPAPAAGRRSPARPPAAEPNQPHVCRQPICDCAAQPRLGGRPPRRRPPGEEPRARPQVCPGGYQPLPGGVPAERRPPVARPRARPQVCPGGYQPLPGPYPPAGARPQVCPGGYQPLPGPAEARPQVCPGGYQPLPGPAEARPQVCPGGYQPLPGPAEARPQVCPGGYQPLPGPAEERPQVCPGGYQPLPGPYPPAQERPQVCPGGYQPLPGPAEARPQVCPGGYQPLPGPAEARPQVCPGGYQPLPGPAEARPQVCPGGYQPLPGPAEGRPQVCPGGYQPLPGPAEERPQVCPGGYQPLPGPAEARPQVCPGGYQPLPGPAEARPQVCPGGYQPLPGPAEARPQVCPGGYQPLPGPAEARPQECPGGYQPLPGPRSPAEAPPEECPGGYQPLPGPCSPAEAPPEECPEPCPPAEKRSPEPTPSPVPHKCRVPICDCAGQPRLGPRGDRGRPGRVPQHNRPGGREPRQDRSLGQADASCSAEEDNQGADRTYESGCDNPASGRRNETCSMEDESPGAIATGASCTPGSRPTDGRRSPCRRPEGDSNRAGSTYGEDNPCAEERSPVAGPSGLCPIATTPVRRPGSRQPRRLYHGDEDSECEDLNSSLGTWSTGNDSVCSPAADISGIYPLSSTPTARPLADLSWPRRRLYHGPEESECEDLNSSIGTWSTGNDSCVSGAMNRTFSVGRGDETYNADASCTEEGVFEDYLCESPENDSRSLPGWARRGTQCNEDGLNRTFSMDQSDESYGLDDSCPEEIFAGAFPARERTPVGGSCPPAGGPSRARARSSSPYGGSCPPGMAPPRGRSPVAGPSGLRPRVFTPPGRPRADRPHQCRRLDDGSDYSGCEDLNSSLGTLSSGNGSVCPPAAGPPEYVRTPPGRPRPETYKARRRLYHGSEGSECEDLNSPLGTWSSGNGSCRADETYISDDSCPAGITEDISLVDDVFDSPDSATQPLPAWARAAMRQEVLDQEKALRGFPLCNEDGFNRTFSMDQSDESYGLDDSCPEEIFAGAFPARERTPVGGSCPLAGGPSRARARSSSPYGGSCPPGMAPPRGRSPVAGPSGLRPRVFTPPGRPRADRPHQCRRLDDGSDFSGCGDLNSTLGTLSSGNGSVCPPAAGPPEYVRTPPGRPRHETYKARRRLYDGFEGSECEDLNSPLGTWSSGNGSCRADETYISDDSCPAGITEDISLVDDVFDSPDSATQPLPAWARAAMRQEVLDQEKALRGFPLCNEDGFNRTFSMDQSDESYGLDDSCPEEIFAGAFPARERTPVGGSCPPAGGPSRARARSSSPYGGSCPPGMASTRGRSPVAGPSGLRPRVFTPPGRPRADRPHQCRRLDDGSDFSGCGDLNSTLGTLSSGNGSVCPPAAGPPEYVRTPPGRPRPETYKARRRLYHGSEGSECEDLNSPLGTWSSGNGSCLGDSINRTITLGRADETYISDDSCPAGITEDISLVDDVFDSPDSATQPLPAWAREAMRQEVLDQEKALRGFPLVCPPAAGPPEYVRTPPGRPRHETYKARRRLYHGSEGSECEDVNSTLGTLSSGNESSIEYGSNRTYRMCEPDDSYTMDDSCNEEIFASAFPARERTPVGGSCPPAGGPSRARARSSSPYGGSCPPGMAPPRARSPVAGPSGLCPIISTPRGRPAEDLPYPCRRLDDGNESSECEDLNLSIGTWSTGNESSLEYGSNRTYRMCEPDDSYNTLDDSCNEEIFASAFPARERTPVGGSCPPAGGPSRARARSSSPYGGSCPAARPRRICPRDSPEVGQCMRMDSTFGTQDGGLSTGDESAYSPVAGPSGLCRTESTPSARPLADLSWPRRRLNDGSESSECEEMNSSFGAQDGSWSTGYESSPEGATNRTYKMMRRADISCTLDDSCNEELFASAFPPSSPVGGSCPPAGGPSRARHRSSSPYGGSCPPPRRSSPVAAENVPAVIEALDDLRNELEDGVWRILGNETANVSQGARTADAVVDRLLETQRHLNMDLQRLGDAINQDRVEAQIEEAEGMVAAAQGMHGNT